MTTAVCALAGGVGAAKMLRGVVRAVDPRTVTAIVNTGDDVVLHGLHVSPDLDTITYTLAEAVNAETGWGIAGETWEAMSALDRYAGASRQDLTWFRLGDKDLATHLFRTQRLRDGLTLTEVTAEVTAVWGIDVRILPVTDDALETRVTVEGEGEIGFQEYFVGRQHNVTVTGVRFAGADRARPGPAVLGAIDAAEVVLICPSNPIVSIGPLLAVPGVRSALAARRATAVAVSPIVAGAALKGPADRMLRELGHDASVVGVARLYRDLAATLVVDEADRDLAPLVEEAGMRCVVAPTIMRSAQDAAALGRRRAGRGRIGVVTITIFGLAGIGEVNDGDRLATVIAAAAAGTLAAGDVLVVTQKIVSKAEGRLVPVNLEDPGSAKELVEQESVRILRRRGELIISETRHGFVCANAGIDLSNVPSGFAALLPVDCDRSARRIRDGLRADLGIDVGVIISDTFGRPWRKGLTDVAIGVAGIAAVVDLRGTTDALGRELQVTEVAVADEIASAAELVMGKATGVPVAVVRGLDASWFRDASVAAEIIRPASEDLFR